MQNPTRRRALSIFAGALATAAAPVAAGGVLYRWQGIALGARATIVLDHPEAPALARRARAEIARLEAIFSLYRADSALARLNRDGRLVAPPPELLACLSLAQRLGAVTGGLFDPFVQPLWALHARHAVEGTAPTAADLAQALGRPRWEGTRLAPDAIVLPAGAALTLNGIAQGWIADRVAALLRAEGLDDVLVDTGELRALGGDPRGGDWAVDLAAPAGKVGAVRLRDAALASSAVLGTTFDAAGRMGHILDPRTGLPGAPRWRLVSVTAPDAAVADALSTAFCLMERPAIEAALARVQGARLAWLG